MKTVLIAPLDWGLGHATRCIPVIRALLERNCRVVIAGNGRSLELLRLEFPELSCFVLPGYHPQYPARGSMALKMIKQIPKFFSVIRREHESVKKIIAENAIDIVISDNRYGCWSSSIPSVFITHQSNILMPKRFGWLSAVVRKLNERMIRRFSYCWIPDFSGEQSLAGSLASLGRFKTTQSFRYIGTLSRMKPEVREKRYDLLCIFSGPEPQRSMLESIVVAQLQRLHITAAIVRGIPVSEREPPITVTGDVFEMATTTELQQLIAQSDVVLARSGFSTVMDLAKLRKKAIFIPTPGQTEQEYLATRFMERGIAYHARQHNFDLEKALREVITFQGFEDLPEEGTLLQNAIDEVLK